MQLQGIPEQIQKVLLSTKHSLFYPKSGLLNGHNSVNFDGQKPASSPIGLLKNSAQVVLSRSCQTYEQNILRSHQNGSLNFVLRFACEVGAAEFPVIFSAWFFLLRAQDNHGYFCIETSFRKFTLSQLKRATRGSIEETGRGGGGTACIQKSTI